MPDGAAWRCAGRARGSLTSFGGIVLGGAAWAVGSTGSGVISGGSLRTSSAASRILAGAGRISGLAVAGDIEPAGVGRLDLVRAGLGADQLGRAAGRRVLPAEPEHGPGDDRRGEQHQQQRDQHLARRDAARAVLVLDRLQPGQ